MNIPSLLRSTAAAAAMALAAGLASSAASAALLTHQFVFSTEAPGVGTPTGSFAYDPDTGRFEDFQVLYRGVTHDFTAVANVIGTHRLPFELGTLGPNLIDGFGPLRGNNGEDLAHWYATPDAFIGFEWRTPAQDFLSFGIMTAAPGWTSRSRIAAGHADAFAGTWRTTPAQSVPAPATWALLAVALGAAGFVLWRTRRMVNTMNDGES